MLSVFTLSAASVRKAKLFLHYFCRWTVVEVVEEGQNHLFDDADIV